jgi:hypothetical protein
MQLREPRTSTAKSPAVRTLFKRRSVYLRGTHWLVMSPASWRLELADGLLVRDTSSSKRLDMAVARLQGEKLDALSVSVRTGMTTFYFDLGARITVRVRASSSAESELWSLNDRAHVVAVAAGGLYSYGSVKKSPEPSTPLGGAEPKWLVVARTAKIRSEILGKLR